MENYDLQVALDCCINYANKEYDCLKKKRDRMYKFVVNELSLENKVYFCTFTFKDEYLINNMFDRKEFVQWLNRKMKLKCRLYIDYGDDYDRVHLHGFCSTSRYIKNGNRKKRYGNYNHFELSQYGHTKFIRIRPNDKNLQKTFVKYTIDYSIKDNIKFRMICVNPKIML